MSRAQPAPARPPKLLYFVTEDYYFVSHRLALGVAAQAAGFDVAVITRVRNHGSAIEQAGLRVIPFENVRSRLNPLAEVLTIARLVAVYRRERPDIVHHVAMKPILYGTLAARLSRVPTIVNAVAGLGWMFTSAAGLARGLGHTVRWALRHALAAGIVIVQNPDDVQLVTKMGVPRDRIRHVPGAGVDLRVFRPAPQPAGVPAVVLPARLLWDKGVGEFIEAARLLRVRGVPARFVLAGEPDPLNPASVAMAQVEAWVGEGIVDYRGWVDDMPGLLAEAAIVCLPSYREGLPKSLIEAAAAGRPIVTTDVPGCRAVVRHGDNGFLVPLRDARTLADVLERLLLDEPMRAAMGARGRIRAEGEFALDRIIQQTLAVYTADRIGAGAS